MTISGLLTVKPANTPKVGDVRCYMVENRVAQSGNTWNKIKGSTPDNGGQSYKVLSVTPTGRTDKYGNISLNIEVEPANGAQPLGPSTSLPPRQQRQSLHNGDDRSSRIERQHSQEMSLRYFALSGIKPSTTELREMTSWFQRDISHIPELKNPSREPSGPSFQSKPEEEPDETEVPF
jgi:hypothetical protein